MKWKTDGVSLAFYSLYTTQVFNFCIIFLFSYCTNSALKELHFPPKKYNKVRKKKEKRIIHEWRACRHIESITAMCIIWVDYKHYIIYEMCVYFYNLQSMMLAQLNLKSLWSVIDERLELYCIIFKPSNILMTFIKIARNLKLNHS